MEVVRNGRYDAAAQKVIFTVKHFSKYTALQSKATFDDLEMVLWAKDSIEALAAREIVSGYGNNMFIPNANITREEFIKMLVNTFDLLDETAVSSFKDVKEGAWYYSFVASAEKNGITSGYTDGTFGVGKLISRQEMAAMVYRAASLSGVKFEKTIENLKDFDDSKDIEEYAKEAVTAMHQANIINGIGDNKFGPGMYTTRAQAAKVIYSIIKIMN